MTRKQKVLIEFVSRHGGIFATPCHVYGIWIYIPFTDRSGRVDVLREYANSIKTTRDALGY